MARWSMSGHRGLRAALCVGLCAGWLETSALALDQNRSVLLVAGEGPLGSRIGAELEAQGLRVVRSAPAELPMQSALSEATDAELIDLAQRMQAAALVRVSASGVEVWRIEATTAETPSERLQTEPTASDDSERVVAARIVELLRTDALDLSPPASPTREASIDAPAPLPDPSAHADTLAPDAAGARVTPALGGALLLEVGVGLSAGTDDLGAAPLLGASVFWQPAPLAAFGLTASVPLRSPELSAAEGSARVQSWSLAAGPRLYPLGANAVLEPFVGLGLGVLWFNVEGTRASSSLELTGEQLVVAGPHASLGARWRVLDSLSLLSCMEATYALAKPVVEFADRQVATLGRPFLTLRLGIEFRAGDSGSGD